MFFFFEVSHDQLCLEEGAFDRGKLSDLDLAKEGGGERSTIDRAALRVVDYGCALIGKPGSAWSNTIQFMGGVHHDIPDGWFFGQNQSKLAKENGRLKGLEISSARLEYTKDCFRTDFHSLSRTNCPRVEGD